MENEKKTKTTTDDSSKKSKKQKTKTICRVGDSSGNDKSGKNKLETHTSTKIAKS